MPLYIASLNSGSNGNCYYIGNENEAVFIDAGLSCRETERRMDSLKLEMEKVKAIFISHEHSDHITGMCGIAKKWKIPVYITPQTRASCRIPLPPEWTLSYESDERIAVGALQILAFAKYHDACHPHSFVVSDGAVNIGVFTDLGRVCKELEHHLGTCDAAFLEANYDEEMLANGHYPYHLKKRISGGLGHLSNREALEVFKKVGNVRLSHLFLAHLSKENNHPDLVRSLFEANAGSTKIFVASRYAASPVFRVDAAPAERRELQSMLPKRVRQLALF